MPVLDPEARSARARLAAKTRHHGPDADTADETAEIERARIDRKIDDLVAAAPKMTSEQSARLRRLFIYAPADEGSAAG